jgi:RNA polymerase sigma-70 factor (ECF subfamily)
MTDQLDLIYERVLVVRCQAGDEAALAELVERYSARLRYFLRKLLGAGRANQVDDLLQEVWLTVFRQLPRLAAPQAFRAWVYRIARDHAFGTLRKSGREQALGDFEVPDDGLDEDEFSADDAARIHAALDLLAPEHREALVLRFLESMCYDDIARITRTSLGTVRSRIHYGKRALRRILEKDLSHDR